MSARPDRGARTARWHESRATIRALAIASVALLALAPRALAQEVGASDEEPAPREELGESSSGPDEAAQTPSEAPSSDSFSSPDQPREDQPSDGEPAEAEDDEPRESAPRDPPGASRLEWNEEWTKIGASHVIIASIAGGIVIASRILGPVPDPWVEFNDFDEAFRDGLRMPNEGARRVIRDFSDVGLTIAVAYPILVDAILLAAYVHDNPEVAAQIAMIAVETYAFVSAMWGVANISLSRERPYGRVCGSELPADTYACDDDRRFYSSFSGHAALTMTAAALTCVTHANMPLLPGALGLVPCLGGIGISLLTGLGRIAGDQHYATDVIGGWGIGALVGFLLPTILHYRGGIFPTGSASGLEMRFHASSDGIGLEGSF